MKENNDILNNNQKIYELKSEYMDDLVMKLDKQRPNKRRGFYIAFSLLLLLLVTGTVLWYPSNELKENKKLVENNNSSVEFKNKEMSPVNQGREKQNLSIIINSNKEEPTILINETAVDKSANLQSEKVKKSNAIAKKTNGSLLTKKIPGKLNDKSEKSGLSNSLNLNNRNGLALVKTIEKEEKETIEITDANTENRSEAKTKDSLKSKTLEKHKEIEKEVLAVEKDTSSKNGTQENEQITELEKEDDTDSIHSGKIIDTNINHPTIETVDSLIMDDSTKLIAQASTFSMNVDSSKLLYHWQFSLLAGANISLSRFSNSINQEYLNSRKEEEDYLVSFSGGISIERFISENVKITTGLNYMAYGSKNKYSPMTSYKDSRQFNGFDSVYNPIIDSIFYNPTRMWIPYLIRIDSIVDSSFINNKVAYEDSTAFLSRGKVTFSYVEIPLMIGYYRTLNKWSFGINTGVSIGLLTGSSGYYIGKNLTTIEVAKSQKIMWNYLLGPEVNYEFRENYYLGFQSNFRLGLNNLSISEPIDRKYYNLQFNAKVGYRF